jgi:hypothetical protein
MRRWLLDHGFFHLLFRCAPLSLSELLGWEQGYILLAVTKAAAMRRFERGCTITPIFPVAPSPCQRCWLMRE